MEMVQLRKLQPPEPLQHLYFTHPFAHRPLVTFMLSIPTDMACRAGRAEAADAEGLSQTVAANVEEAAFQRCIWVWLL
ncbi:MAG: hypothetical protein DMG57_16570 [Acidobacteria bacterium]|nr:MAG: hypothetical protein DMG57_16570 [Acidobacteriota bacterium]